MKKTISSLIVLMVMLIALAGCGDSAKTKGESTEDKKTLRVVTDAAYPPMENMDKGKIVGLDIDFIKAVAKEAGYKVKIENVGWDPLMIEVESKRADMAISSITINPDRLKKYDFSVPYFLSTNKILVPEGSDIKSAKDLEGKKVAVQAGTTGHFATEKILGKNNKNIKKFDNNTLAIMELTKKGADAVVADNAIIEAYAKNHPNEKLTVIEDKDNFEDEFYGIMFPKGSDKDLVADFNKAINKVFDSGKYDEIYKKWLSGNSNVDIVKKQQNK